MRELWLIEAPGKVRTLETVLRSMAGRTSTVYAVNGHVARYADDAGLGIANDLSEPGRVWSDPEIKKTILDLATAENFDIIHIATDADQAGDVIALDIMDILPGSVNVDRIRLRGIDKVSLVAALQQPEKITKAAASAGRARAMIDRLLTASYSKPGLAVGRVQTAMLSSVMADQDIPIAKRYNLVVPANDGKDPFSCEVGPEAVISDEWLSKLLKRPPRAVQPGDLIHANFGAWHFGDTLIGLSDCATKNNQSSDVTSLANSCQMLYQGGRMSYPRSNMRLFTPQKAEKIVKEAGRLGADVVPYDMPVPSDSGAHDPLHIIGGLSRNITPGIGSPEGMLREIHHASLRATHLWPGQMPDRDDLTRAFEEFGMPSNVARELSGKRWIRWDGSAPPGVTKPTSSSMFVRPPDAVLLDLLVKNEIGTPASWPDLVANAFTGKPLVELDTEGRMKLTDRGMASLEAAPKFMRSINFTKALQKGLENIKVDPGDPAPWKKMTVMFIGALPPDDKEIIRKTLIRANTPKDDVSMSDLGVSQYQQRNRGPVIAPTMR